MKNIKQFLNLCLILAIVCAGLSGCVIGPDPDTSGSPSTAAPADPPVSGGPVTRYLPVEAVRYDSEGALWYKRTCTYDEKGRLLCYTFHDLEDGTGTYSYTYTYDDRGHLTSTVYQDASFTDRQTFAYTYHADGTVAAYETGDLRFAFSYDEAGRVLSRVREGADSDQGGATVCSYDEQGQLTELAGKFPDIYTFTYDEKGNLSGLSGGSYMIQFRWDEQGNRLCRQHPMEQYSWDFLYTDGQLTGIRFTTGMDYGETRAREYVLNPDGTVASIQWASGGRTEYTYESVTLTLEEAAAIPPVWNEVNEPLMVADYYSDPLAYLLPHPNFKMGALY